MITVGCARTISQQPHERESISHGILELSQGNIMENSGNFLFIKCWEPCRFWWSLPQGEDVRALKPWDLWGMATRLMYVTPSAKPVLTVNYSCLYKQDVSGGRQKVGVDPP